MMGATYNYVAYGRSIRSDSRLPFLLPLESQLEPAIWVHGSRHPTLPDFPKTPWVRSRERTAADRPWLTMQRFVDDGGFEISFGDGPEFVVEGTGRHIWASGLQFGGSPADYAYLYGFVFAIAFYLQGSTCLHASAVSVEGKGLLFVGDSGYGKSTLAAAFVQRGLPLLSDDLVVMDPAGSAFEISPAFPIIRLSSEASALLVSAGQEVRRADPDVDKVMVVLQAADGQFAQEPATLHSVYLLGRVDQSQSEIRLTRVRQREAVLALSCFGYLPHLLDRKMRQAEFETLTSLVQQTPVWQLPRVVELSQIPLLCDMILEGWSGT